MDLHRVDTNTLIPSKSLDVAAVDALRGIEAQLKRIADAIEPTAAFAELLQQGAPQVEHVATAPDLAPDGLPWGKR